MARPEIHAPDGGIFGAPLCQGPDGDTTVHRREVTCGECDDILTGLEIEADHDVWASLAEPLQRLRTGGLS